MRDRGEVNRRTHLAHTQDMAGSTPAAATIRTYMLFGRWDVVEDSIESLLQKDWTIEALAPYLLPNGELHVVGAMVKRG